jgi:hypothetical protein
MATNTAASGYARLRPWQARSVLAGLVLLLGFALAVRPAPPHLPKDPEERASLSDMALYQAEVQRIHAGEGYYAAAAHELVARNYPTRSVFNWRTPLPMWLVGKLPDAVMGKLLLIAAALLLVLSAFEIASREEPNVYLRAVPLALLLVLALLPCVIENVFMLPVLWAGVFVGLSLCAYGLNRPNLGVAAGLTAVFLRELALPYCLLALALAVWQRRRGEAAVWLLGLVGWALFFGLHYWQVGQIMPPDAQAHREGWIRFGGATFVLATVNANTALLLSPVWITAFYFAAAMFGLAGWRTPLGLRVGLTVSMYVVAFSIVGQDFNAYWGLLIAPLFCFGVARAPVSLVELWRAADMGKARSVSEECASIAG